MPLLNTPNGPACHYFEAGAGNPVLLLHGSASAGAAWRSVVQPLVTDHHIFAPDLPGYGLSEPWRRGERLSPECDRGAVKAALDLVSEPMHVVAHSYGGAVAIQAAKHHPDRIASLTPAPAKRVTEHLSVLLGRADSAELAGAGHLSPHTHADLVAGHIRGHIAATAEPSGKAA
ncbi:MAG: alpha/beta fold hydrolase [Alphaproteobacteria bacterium]|nr:alpha/beta fold hydrolase [Alphaproteobacteria bacterium]